MDTHIAFVAVQPKNGTITIPAQLRRRFGLDKPGAQVEIVVRDGEIVLVPHIAIPADQAWFWSKEWQAKEREADEELASGQRLHFQSGEEFVAFLDQLIEDGDEQE
jgi:AbrB family looped-hinge helix DNA binding protein